MKLKLQQISQIKKVFEPMVRVKLPAKLAYKVYKFVREVESEENFFTEKIREIANEYGKKDADGKFMTDENEQLLIQEDKQEAFRNAMTELNGLEVDVPDTSFTVDELAPLPLSVLDMEILKDFIKEE